MKKAYQIFHYLSILGSLPLLLLNNRFPSLRALPFLLLPLSICSITAAVLWAMLPTAERDYSWMNFFSRTRSPAFYALIISTFNILLFLPSVEMQNRIIPIFCFIIIIAVIVELFFCIKGPPKRKTITKRELKRRKNRPPKEGHI